MQIFSIFDNLRSNHSRLALQEKVPCIFGETKVRILHRVQVISSYRRRRCYVSQGPASPPLTGSKVEMQRAVNASIRRFESCPVSTLHAFEV